MRSRWSSPASKPGPRRSIRHQELSAAIAENADTQGAGTQNLDALLALQSDAAAEVERLGGWDLRHQAEAMLGHLGVTRPDQRVGTMSGGERRRVALARLLVSRPDFAILDEPTNHLDIDTIEWLERYLSERFTGALLLITHDRYLLDRVVTRTLEIEDGAVHSYSGGWAEYLAARAERQAHAERVAANRRNLLRRELEWMRRQPKARTGKQKARINRANELLAVGSHKREHKANIGVEKIRSGHTVLDIKSLAVEVAGRILVEDITLNLGKRERIGIVGKNGTGKTSLLRVLMGELEPATGSVKLGKNTRIAYLDQSRSGLDDSDTVFDSVAEGTLTRARGRQRRDRALLSRAVLVSALGPEEKSRQPVGRRASSGGPGPRPARSGQPGDPRRADQRSRRDDPWPPWKKP